MYLTIAEYLQIKIKNKYVVQDILRLSLGNQYEIIHEIGISSGLTKSYIVYPIDKRNLLRDYYEKELIF